MAGNRSKYGLSLPFHKTNVSKQTSYTYHTVNGDITLTPISDGRLRVTSSCDPKRCDHDAKAASALALRRNG